jgi:hypothetical protein
MTICRPLNSNSEMGITQHTAVLARGLLGKAILAYRRAGGSTLLREEQ